MYLGQLDFQKKRVSCNEMQVLFRSQWWKPGKHLVHWHAQERYEKASLEPSWEISTTIWAD
jgi:hypothetical protein